jgi:hypothetical protein
MHHAHHSQIDPDHRQSHVRTRRLHLACFAATVAILAFVGVLRKTELSQNADSTLRRAVMFLIQSDSDPRRG